MADQRAAKAMLDKPGRAMWAPMPVAAGAADCERRIPPAVQKEQRLFVARDRLADSLTQKRRQPAAARRRVAPQIDRGKVGQRAAGGAARQLDMAVAALRRIHSRFDRRRRVIGDAVLLLVGRLVLLIDDNESKPLERQEQGRACAGDDTHLARRHAGPDAGAPAARGAGMPFGRAHAEAAGEAIEELSGERNFRHQDEHLAAGRERRRDRFEINFGLARAGDAFEQRRRETAACHRGTEYVRGLRLRQIEERLGKGDVGRERDRLRRRQHGLQRAFVDQPVDYAA